MCCETCSSCCSKAPSLEPGNTDIWHQSWQTFLVNILGFLLAPRNSMASLMFSWGFCWTFGMFLRFLLGFGNQKLQDDLRRQPFPFPALSIITRQNGCWSCAVQRCAAAMRGQHELESFAKPLCNMETSKRCQQKLHRN